MAVRIGSKTYNNGWTTIDPKPDSSFTTWSAQFGTGYNGDGTRFLFFAPDTASPPGSDGGNGTPANPFRKVWYIDPFYGKSRNNHPDWWLFRKGTKFTLTQDGETVSLPFGPAGDPSNLTNFYPMVITSYDPAAPNNPPLFNPASGGAPPIWEWDGVVPGAGYSGNNGGRGNNVAFGGIATLSSRSDPENAAFTGQEWIGTVFAMGLLNQASFFLVEDCWVRNSGFAVNGNGGYSYFRRNRFRYNVGSGLEVQGMNTADTLIEENLIDCCSPRTLGQVTFNTTANTATIAAQDPELWANGRRIKLYPTVGSTLPSPLIPHEVYWVVNSVTGAQTVFQLASSSSGAPLDLSGGSGTFYGRSGGQGRTHAIYGSFGADAQFGYLNIRGNIITNEDDGSFSRGGGTIHNNFFGAANAAFNQQACIAGRPSSVTYNVATRCANAFSFGGSAYQFTVVPRDRIDVSYNIVAHNEGYGGNVALQYEGSAHGGTLSHNIVYDWGSYDHGVGHDGYLREFTVTNAGIGCDGRVANFKRDYPHGSGGTQSVGNIVGGSGGTDGTYTDVDFTGGSGTAARGDVIVSGGAVTAVHLTRGGDLAYVSGETLTSSAGGGLPTGWSFKIYPYTIEMRDSPFTSGTGCQVYAIVTFDGQIHAPNYGIGNLVDADYSGIGINLSRSQGPNHAVMTEEATWGCLKIVAGGTRYSTDQVLVPFSVSGGPPPNPTSLANLPTGFNIKVGPYPKISHVQNDQGLAVSGGSGSGGKVALNFASSGGTSTITSAIPFLSGATNVEEGGDGAEHYAIGDNLTVPADPTSGVSGVQLRCTVVSKNTDDGTNSYNASFQPWIVAIPSGGRSRDAGTYMTFLGNPGGEPSTFEGYLNAYEKFQTRSTWNDLLSADSLNDYIRQGQGMPMLGSAYASLSGALTLDDVLPDGTVGSVYNSSVTASGGTAPYTYTVSSGALPSGLSLNASSGQITGTPTVAGTYSFTINATDTASNTGVRGYSVVISAGTVAAQFLFGDIVLDQGLTALSLANIMHLCSAMPTNYASVIAATLGNKNLGPGNVFGPINAGVGRERSSVAFSGGAITANGTASYWAAVDSVNSRLLAAGSVATARGVTSGGQFSMPAITVGLKRA